MKKGILIITFIIVVLLGISCAYASENTTDQEDLSAFESTDSVEVPAGDVEVDDSVTVNKTAADDFVNDEENKKSDVLGASASDDDKSVVVSQDDVLMSEMGNVLGATKDDGWGSLSKMITVKGIMSSGIEELIDFKITYKGYYGGVFNYDITYDSWYHHVHTTPEDMYEIRVIAEWDASTVAVITGDGRMSVGETWSFNVSMNPDDKRFGYILKYAHGETKARTFMYIPYDRFDTTTTVNSIDINYFTGDFSVSGTVKSGSQNVDGGNVTVKIGSITKNATVSNGTWILSGFNSKSWDQGNQTITASYSGTYGEYKSSSGSGTLTFDKITPTITLNDIAAVTYNGNFYTVSGTADASVTSGNVSLKTDTGVTLTGTTVWSSGTWYVTDINSTLLDPGTYTVTAIYSGNEYHKSASSAGKSLTVNKMTPTVIVTGNPSFKYNINQGQTISGRILNSINGKYGGHVNITIDGVLVKSNVEVNTDGTWNFTNYDTGRFPPSSTPYTIAVSYSGNEFYYAGTATGTYTVSSGDSIPVVVSDGDINVGDSKTVKVTVRYSKGVINDSTVVLKGTGLPSEGLSLITDSEGNVVFSVPDLATGYYDDWMVIVKEDERYIPLFNQTVEPFYVKDALNIIITDVVSYHSTYPDNIVITGKTNANDNPVGSVNMTLGDRTVNAPLVNGVFTATFTGVIPGKYGTVTAVFIPDSSEHRYGGHVQELQLSQDVIIDKFSPVIEIINVQMTKELYPGVVSISFRLIGAENGRLPTGRVEAVFEGKLGNGVFVNSSDVYTLDVGNLPEGTFNITLNYLGDNYYANVKNYTSDITIKPDSVLSFIDNYYDVFSESVVNVSSNMNGRTLMVYLDGNYYGDIVVENDKSQINLGVLTAGDHTVTVKFEGDDLFTKIYESHVITVNKFDSILDVAVNAPLYVDDMVFITVNVNETAGGYVSVNVNNKDYHLKINDHVASLNLTGLAYGTYIVSVNYLGDEHYNTNFTSKNFTVNRYESGIVVADITIGDDLQINLTSFDGYDSVEVTGKLNITIGSITLNDLSVVDGKVIVPADKLPALPGKYDAALTYSGNYKFLPVELTTLIVINKLPAPTIIPVLNVTIDDDLNITIAGDERFVVDGNVSVKINDGESFVLPVVDGVFTIPYDKLPQAESQSNIKVSYANGTYYSDSAAEWSLHSDKITNYLFTISNDTIKFEQNATLTIVLPDDVNTTLTIKIGGVDKNVSIIGGRGTLENIGGLHAGLNTVISEFTSGKYETSTATGFIQVNPNDITLNITVPSEQLYVGQSATITVQANVSMNNSVTLYVNGKAETVKLTDGVGSFTIDSLVYGGYEFAAEFEGNENYTRANAVMKFFYVKKPVEFVISVDDIKEGENASVNVAGPVDATGDVVITVDGKNYTGTISDGMAVIEVAGLGVGVHTVDAVYFDGKQYNASGNGTVSFLVKANVTIFTNVTTRGYNSGMDYEALFTDSLGNPLGDRDVVISVGGVDYTVKTDSNGVARLNVKLPVGYHTISMINPETGEETHSNLTIAPRLIENKNVVTDYNSGFLYKVRVIGDDGEPVGAGVKFTVPISGKKYTYVTDKNGYITIKVDKRFKLSYINTKLVYKLKLSYKGYTIQNTITVKQVLKTKKVVKVKKSSKKLVLKATLKWSNKKPISGKMVKFKFKGKTYKAKTNSKGVAKVVIKKSVLKKLRLGKNYKVRITYLTDTIKSWVKYRR